MDLMTVITRLRRRADLAPSLYDLLPHADALPRSTPRLELVPAEAIGGTTRHPSNTRADFVPAGTVGAHWRDDLRRIVEAQERLAILPPVDLIKVAGCYFVIDGHKRVAAARRSRAILDASVVELHLPAAYPSPCAAQAVAA